VGANDGQRDRLKPELQQKLLIPVSGDGLPHGFRVVIRDRLRPEPGERGLEFAPINGRGGWRR
ncbi:MAG: hypothetical protein JJT96_02950, partial [Opitutales bacterium]|nr:hypothetical protein [Opitutales bacterium]